MYKIAGLDQDLRSVIGDIRDQDRLSRAVREARPEAVIHLAAQPLVRAGYLDPVGTYEVNVLGTVNLLESLKAAGRLVSVLNVTTDKVYRNDGRERPFREGDPLGGHDPYANSKSCSELVTAAYIQSFFRDGPVAISTARGGNVIGGGDFAPGRIVPDCLRAALASGPVIVRNPLSVRPYQHVLEALEAYLMILAGQAERPGTAGAYNVGPAAEGCSATGDLVKIFCRLWGQGLSWEARPDGGPPEDKCLRLDSARLTEVFGWRPRWDIEEALGLTVDWARVWSGGGEVVKEMDREIGLVF